MVYSRSRSAMVNWLRALSKLAPVPLAVGAFLLTQQLRQLGDVGGDAPGLVIERAPQKEPQAAKPLGVRRSSNLGFGPSSGGVRGGGTGEPPGPPKLR
jgi:hypothetical protein